jgi:hypothetical protein
MPIVKSPQLVSKVIETCAPAGSSAVGAFSVRAPKPGEGTVVQPLALAAVVEVVAIAGEVAVVAVVAVVLDVVVVDVGAEEPPQPARASTAISPSSAGNVSRRPRRGGRRRLTAARS